MSIILCVILPTLLWADTHIYTFTQDLSTGGSIPGAPTDGDAIEITGGDIIMDLAMTGSGLSAATITAPGRLVAPISPGNYTLRMTNRINGTGCIYFVGPTEGDVPEDVNISIFTTYNGILFNLSGINRIQCTDPTLPLTTVNADYPAGTTKIYVQDILSVDWRIGRVIRIDKAYHIPQSTEYTITNLGTDIDGQYMVISPGLTVSIVTNSLVILATRNIRFVGNKGAIQTCFASGAGSTIKTEIRNFSYGFSSTSNININGSLFVDNGYGLRYTDNVVAANVIFTKFTVGFGLCNMGNYTNCLWSGGSTGTQNGSANVLNNCTFYGLSTGNTTMVSGRYQNCTWKYTATGVLSSSGNTFVNAIFQNNSRGGTLNHDNHYINCNWANNSAADFVTSFNEYISDSSILSTNDTWQAGAASRFNNTQFLSAHVYTTCTSATQGILEYNESQNEGGDSRIYHAFTIGGTVNSDLTVFPIGHDFSYRHNPSSDIYPSYWQFTRHLAIGQRIGVSIHYKCDSINWVAKPKFEIIDKYHDPLGSDTEVSLAAYVVDDSDTNWHTAQLQYANIAGTQLQDIIIRATAQDASKIFYSRMDIIYPGTVGVRSCGN
jgi:hypothetical protein